jgi:hypothetical protein
MGQLMRPMREIKRFELRMYPRLIQTFETSMIELVKPPHWPTHVS